MMRTIYSSAAAGALMVALSGGFAAAQSLNSTDAVEDRVTAVQDATQDAFDTADDANRFGATRYQRGWRGNIYASADMTSGNSDTMNFSLGSKVTNSVGVWNQTINLAYEYGEANGAETKNELYSLYDVNRDFSDRLYAYALVRGEKDYVSNTSEVFLGFGPGYRIAKDPNFAWRVQAGPGYRVSTQGGLVPNFDEAGASASSRIFYEMSDAMSITNDTDVIWSSGSTLVTNDIGVNMALSGPLSMRVGLRTDYDSNPAPGLKKTDTTTGIALVYGF